MTQLSQDVSLPQNRRLANSLQKSNGILSSQNQNRREDTRRFRRNITDKSDKSCSPPLKRKNSPGDVYEFNEANERLSPNLNKSYKGLNFSKRFYEFNEGSERSCKGLNLSKRYVCYKQNNGEMVFASSNFCNGSNSPVETTYKLSTDFGSYSPEENFLLNRKTQIRSPGVKRVLVYDNFVKSPSFPKSKPIVRKDYDVANKENVNCKSVEEFDEVPHYNVWDSQQEKNYSVPTEFLDNNNQIDLASPNSRSSVPPLPMEDEEIVPRVFKPHEIGFPNPGGRNKCWMNASLQAVLNMTPLIEEMIFYVRTTKSKMNLQQGQLILRKFIDIISLRNSGNKTDLYVNMRQFVKTLFILDYMYNSDCQQDAPEFLVRLFDYFREEFCRMKRLSVESNDCLSLHDLQLENNNKIDSPDFVNEDNPIKDNLEFKIHETYTCCSCYQKTEKVQDHLALYLDVTPVESGEISMQQALHQYMKPDVREMKCEKCGGLNSRVEASFSHLPRFLMIQMKRYIFRDKVTEKLSKAVRFSTELQVSKYTTDSASLPKTWVPISERKSNLEAKSENPGEPIPNIGSVDLEDPEFQEALFKSLDESSSREEEREEKDLQAAIQASLSDIVAPSVPETPPGDGFFNVNEDSLNECERNDDYSYRLIGIILHQGFTPNSGHYVADVFNLEHKKWFHYDDETVTEIQEEEVLGRNRQRSGYVFFYMHKHLFEVFTKNGYEK